MSSRRQFLLQAALASGALMVGTTTTRAGSPKDKRALRILVLGATGFIGPHHVRAALARGHRVSAFIYRPDRDKDLAALPADVEPLLGDRNGDLESIKNRDWDAVIDLATFGPIWVRSLGEALRGRVKHYTFISTNAVYDHPSASAITTEESPVKAYTWREDPYTITKPNQGLEQYGALKHLCEQEAEKQFPGRSLILRPTLIFGPGGYTLAAFWMDRLSHGGNMLAAGEPSMPVQFVDVRDIAEWVIRMIERDGTGTFNTVGLPPITLEHLLKVMGGIVGAAPNVTWAPSAWLAERNEGGVWTPLTFWADTITQYQRMSSKRAFDQGMHVRAHEVTLADTYAWHKAQSAAEQAKEFYGAKTPEGLPMNWAAYLAREREVLAEWAVHRAKLS